MYNVQHIRKNSIVDFNIENDLVSSNGNEAKS